MKKKKKVIIVADCFNVDKLVGSKRMTALAGFLLSRNIRPYVITAHPDLYQTTVENEALEQELKPVRILSKRFRLLNNSKVFQRLCISSKKHASLFQSYARPVSRDRRNSPSSVLLRIFNRILLMLDNLRADSIYRKALAREKETLGYRYARAAAKLLAGKAGGCTVITSVGGQNGYYEEGPIEMMKLLLQKYKNIEWVYDMRDKLHSQSAGEERNRTAVAAERFIIKNAKYIITVSRGERNSLIETLGLTEEEAKKIKVIYNGYRTIIPEKEEPMEGTDWGLLNIVYTGKVYKDKFHPDLLFEAIGELITEGRLPEQAVRFHYAGSEPEALLSAAESYGCGPIYVDHGFVASAEAVRLQRSADILFGMVRNEGCDIGCIPVKIMEYLGTRKPVIVTISGSEPGAEIKTILDETKSGLALEEIDYQENLKILKNYLLRQYHAKLAGGKTVYDGDEEAVSQYSCSRQFMKYLSCL